jgi:hypothetical protein
MLEPDAGQPASPVLRGAQVSNDLRLLDRGGSRFGLSVAASFVWRCPSNLTVTPFPHPARRTGHADRPHPALGQDITPSPTTGHAHASSGERDRSTRTGARVDSSRPGFA